MNTYEYGRIFTSVADVSPTDDRYSIRYDSEFYKDGTLVDELSSEECSIYVLDMMQEYGFGKYIYKVKAVEIDPSTEAPTGMENEWQESEEYRSVRHKSHLKGQLLRFSNALLHHCTAKNKNHQLKRCKQKDHSFVDDAEKRMQRL